MLDRKYSVLLVDDSSDDRLFLRRILEKSSRFTVIGEVQDGQEAIEYLKGDLPFADRAQNPYPDILLLDLKMPRKSGFDVLRWLQENRSQRLLVFVLSGSQLPADIDRSQKLGADGYFKKTSEKAEQLCMVQTIVDLAEKHFTASC